VKTHVKVVLIATAFGLAAYAVVQVLDRGLRWLGLSPI